MLHPFGVLMSHAMRLRGRLDASSAFRDHTIHKKKKRQRDDLALTIFSEKALSNEGGCEKLQHGAADETAIHHSKT